MTSFPPEPDFGAVASLCAALLGGAIQAQHPCAGLWLRCADADLSIAWLARLQRMVPGVAWSRMHGSATLDRFEDQLDLASSLQQGQRVMRAGVLSRSAGGVLVISAAQQLRSDVAQRLAAGVDAKAFRLILLDASLPDEAMPPASLLMRLPLVLDLRAEGMHSVNHEADESDDACFELVEGPAPRAEPQWIEALVQAGDALGLTQVPYALGALQVARLLARSEGAPSIDQAHVEQAIALALLPRARHLPLVPSESTQAQPPTPEPDSEPRAEPQAQSQSSPNEPPNAPQGEVPEDPLQADASEVHALAQQVIEAAMARLPHAVLAALQQPRERGKRNSTASGQGRRARALHHGRPLGEVPGVPRGGAKLHVLATLKAAAPWQPSRKRQYPDRAHQPVLVQTQDLRLQRFEQGSPTVTLFVVDASGSSALHRLNEAKGAVELMLADCYVRRDMVSLLAFGGAQAQLVLPATRSLVAAKRRLADLPAGGATPLARALAVADLEVQRIQRAGQTPIVVLLTDGRANMALDGRADRAQATRDALRCARLLASRQVQTVLIDTSAQPSDKARELSQALGGRYLALPYADARQMHKGLKAAVA